MNDDLGYLRATDTRSKLMGNISQLIKRLGRYLDLDRELGVGGPRHCTFGLQWQGS